MIGWEDREHPKQTINKVPEYTIGLACPFDGCATKKTTALVMRAKAPGKELSIIWCINGHVSINEEKRGVVAGFVFV